jgi:PhnB protein
MINPYLVFNGECNEVLNFYREVFHCAEPKIMPYGDYMPEGSKTPPELLRTWVMHAEMVICGVNVWFADEANPVTKGANVRLSATVPSGNESAEIFNSLSAGGNVTPA